MLKKTKRAGVDWEDDSQKILSQLASNDAQLTALDLSRSGLEDTDVEKICDAICGETAGSPANNNLTSLNLCSNKLSNQGAAAIARALAGNKKLVNINLCGNAVGDAGAQKLAWQLEHNTDLKNINLFGNAITPAGAKELAEALQRRLDNQQTALDRALMDAKAKGKLSASKNKQQAYASIETIVAVRDIENACEGEEKLISTLYAMITM
jgi:Ran GTPase-activating protein (RanGAP) involved in mRNA processing and transport